MEKKIYKSINAVMGEVEAIGKTHKNELQKYSFRSIDEVLNSLNPLFAKYNIIMLPKYSIIQTEIVSLKEKAMLRVLIEGKFTFITDDESFLEVTTIGEAMDTSDKATNKAMSASLKYCLLQTFLIPTGEQKDSEFESPEIPPEEKPYYKSTVFKATEKQVKYIENLLKNDIEKSGKLLEYYKVKNFSELEKKQAEEIITRLTEKKSA